MNKKLIKYLLKGIIALGTAGFLNGISIVILEDLQATAPSKAVTTNALVEKTVEKPFEDPKNMPKMDLPGLNLLQDLAPAEDPATHILADQNAGNAEPKTDILPAAPEENLDSPEPTETAKNQLIIGTVSTTLLDTAKEEAAAEKHRKNYQLPRIYTTTGNQDTGTGSVAQSAGKEAQTSDFTPLSENNWSTKYESDGGSYRSNTRHNTPSDDEMLSQFVRMMEQENRNKNSNQSYTNSRPQGLGTGSSYKSPNSSSSNSGTSLPKPSPSTGTKDSDKKDSGNNSKAATTPENTAAGLLPFVDEDQDDMNNPNKTAKKLKNKNKKKDQEVKDPKVEKKNQPPVDAKKTDGAPVVSPAATEKKPGEQADTKNDETVPAIPAALLEVHQKFDQALQECAEAEQQQKPFDAAVISRAGEEFSGKAINWITENRKNTQDAAVQKELKKYKLLLELACTDFNNIVENIKKQEMPEQNRDKICAKVNQIKELYQCILNAYNDNAKSNTISPEVKKKSESEKGFLGKFTEAHPEITSALKALGIVGAGLGIAKLLSNLTSKT